jgi:hypothetical protein
MSGGLKRRRVVYDVFGEANLPEELAHLEGDGGASPHYVVAGPTMGSGTGLPRQLASVGNVGTDRSAKLLQAEAALVATSSTG